VRQERSQRSRAALLEGAAELFAEHGYAGTSVADVCTRTGFTKGAVYFHFPSKEALAAAVVQSHHAAWPPLQQTLASRGLPPLEHVVMLTIEVARQFRENVMVRAGVRLQTEREGISEETPSPFVGWIATLSPLLVAAADDGSLRAGVDPEPLARVIVSALFGIQHISEVLNSRNDLLDRLAEMWLVLLPAITPDEDLIARRSTLFAQVRTSTEADGHNRSSVS
jgi:AcrR family transcriptional regulator